MECVLILTMGNANGPNHVSTNMSVITAQECCHSFSGIQSIRKQSSCMMVLHGFKLPSFSGIGCHVFDNLPSIYLHTKIVLEKILKEAQGGGIAGPFHAPPFNNFWVLPLGILPTKEPITFRLIHYLSYSIGLSLNDKINPWDVHSLATTLKCSG